MEQVTALQWINTIIITVGVPAIIGSLIFIGQKLQVLQTLKKEIEDNIRPDLKDVRERFATLEGKTSELFQARSPINLTEKGKRYLQDSGLRAYIDEHRTELMDECDLNQKMETPYDVQQIAFEFFSEHDFPQNVEDQVKTYAFNHGVSMGALRRTAGIYFRDICLKAQGFTSADLDGSGSQNH